MQNPLADNDYTFTKMKGRFCKHVPAPNTDTVEHTNLRFV